MLNQLEFIKADDTRHYQVKFTDFTITCVVAEITITTILENLKITVIDQLESLAVSYREVIISTTKIKKEKEIDSLELAIGSHK